MKFPCCLAVLSVVAFGPPPHAAGQSLAEVARQEAARRQSVARGKVITNDDLKPAPPGSPAPPATAASTPGTTLAPPPPLEKALAADEKKSATESEAAKGGSPATDAKKDEKYWRQRVTTTRDNLARSQTFKVALDARIAALSADFANRDDPAQRSLVASDRFKAIAELDRVKKDILQYETELTTIADEARRAGVPAGWVR